MHSSSLLNMAKCYERFIAGTSLEYKKVVELLDVGGADLNGSYRGIFSRPNIAYRVADLTPGNGVDIVLKDPYHLPLRDGSVDIVISGQMFEHCEFFWIAFREMVRVLAPDGFIFLIAPSTGPVHRVPVDCYRFNPDSFAAIAQYAECRLIDSWQDERGPWHDLVGVFRHHKARVNAKETPIGQQIDEIPWPDDNEYPSSEPSAERSRGRERKLDILEHIHSALNPSTYLEIGVDRGNSLALAQCRAFAIDPRRRLDGPQPESVSFFECTSDRFFEVHAAEVLTRPIDLAFIDGMHRFEFALRDFMNIERYASPAGLVVVDDIFPNHVLQASRLRQTEYWTGDVWKLVPCLRKHRPDLVLQQLDSWPTGLLIIAGLNPDDPVLWDRYGHIVDFYTDGEFLPPREVLNRKGAEDVGSPRCRTLLRELSNQLARRSNYADVRKRLRATGLLNEATVGLRKISNRPALSVVVIAFNMPRELPRTIRSLSPAMQRGIGEDDYEIIVVDNGSTEPIDRSKCDRWGTRLRFENFENATHSPVMAVNHGLALARGEVCGVMIDGAHLVSPGVLAGAAAAAQTHSRPVIATVPFHLGPDIQMRSIFAGYDEVIEDGLLRETGWTTDGYRLFAIASVFGEYRGGWFVPHESNALFMKRSMWSELGGYDERYGSPGGGFANADAYERACELPDTQLIVLLGEGTFHQVHGGVATNARFSLEGLWRNERKRIGSRNRPPRNAIFFGAVHPEALPHLLESVREELSGKKHPNYDLPPRPEATSLGGEHPQGAGVPK